MKVSFKLLLVFILLVFINIAIHEVYIYYRAEETDVKDNINNRLRYEIFTKDLEDRVLGYLTGDWRASNGSQIHIDLLTQPNTLIIDDEVYDIVTIDKIDSIFGIVRLTARNGRLFNQKFQLNKIFDTSGLIVMLFDPETKTCKETKKIDPLAPICAKALYWRQEDNNNESKNKENHNDQR